MAEITLNDPQVCYSIELSFNHFAERWIVPVLSECIEVNEEGQGKTCSIVGKGDATEDTPQSLESLRQDVDQLRKWMAMRYLTINEYDQGTHTSATDVVKAFAEYARIGDQKVTVVT